LTDFTFVCEIVQSGISTVVDELLTLYRMVLCRVVSKLGFQTFSHVSLKYQLPFPKDYNFSFIFVYMKESTHLL
jgi:hypothetical protein